MPSKDKARQAEVARDYRARRKASGSEVDRNYRQRNREKINERKNSPEYKAKAKITRAAYNARHIDTLEDKARKKAYLKKYNFERRDERKDYFLRKTYGIGLADYNAMLMWQQGVCAVCKRPPGVRSLAVDHKHSTGKVRGLLCDCCNVAVGMLHESVDRAYAVADYMKLHE